MKCVSHREVSLCFDVAVCTSFKITMKDAPDGTWVFFQGANVKWEGLTLPYFSLCDHFLALPGPHPNLLMGFPLQNVSVVVRFMCPLDWPRNAQTPGCICEGVSPQRHGDFTWLAKKRRWSSPAQVGIIQPIGNVDRRERRKKGEFALPAEAETPISCSQALAHLFLGLQTQTAYTTSFPGSLVCGQQIVGLLSLHNHVSQSLL